MRTAIGVIRIAGSTADGDGWGADGEVGAACVVPNAGRGVGTRSPRRSRVLPGRTVTAVGIHDGSSGTVAVVPGVGGFLRKYDGPHPEPAVVSAPRDIPPCPRLSEREVQILWGMAQGKRNLRIGADLALSEDSFTISASRSGGTGLASVGGHRDRGLRWQVSPDRPSGTGGTDRGVSGFAPDPGVAGSNRMLCLGVVMGVLAWIVPGLVDGVTTKPVPGR